MITLVVKYGCHTDAGNEVTGKLSYEIGEAVKMNFDAIMVSLEEILHKQVRDALGELTPLIEEVYQRVKDD